MSSKIITELIDDLDGNKADETVRFGFNGQAYEIDLSKQNAKKLRKVFEPYVEAGRKAGRAKTRRRTAAGNGFDPAAVRAWAQSHGVPVNTRGRIAGDVVEQFHAAGN
jgi:hypothetical protein